MKILHVFFSFNMGGAETMLTDIMNIQIKNNEVSLIIINNSYSPKLFEQLDRKIKIYTVNKKRGSKNLFHLLKLNWFVQQINPDIIHCHDADILMYILHQKKVGTVYTAHNTNLPLKGIEMYKQVVSISKAVQEEIYSRTKASSVIINNGIKTTQIAPRSLAETIGKSTFRIVQIGRLEIEDKGQDLLLKAISLLQNKNNNNLPEISVDFFGDGSSMEKLKEMAITLKLGTKVNFLGIKGREYVYSHIKEYDLLVQPSRREGFGLTIAEAMTASVPVLISNLDGPMEVIQEKKYGYFFESNNDSILAEKINYIMKHTEEVNEIAQKARNFALKAYDINITVAKYLELYKHLLEQN